ncbi:MAG: TadE family protein [Elusimicrobiota bacterium]
MSARRGQVLIEVLVMLPVFLMVVFTVMEIGHLAFRTILLHHAAYEVARIGSLSAIAVGAPGCPPPVLQGDKMREVGNAILTNASVAAEPEETLTDPQEGCPHYDVVVTMTQRVTMIFPMTGLMLGSKEDRQARLLTAAVRMPIERPLFK